MKNIDGRQRPVNLDIRSIRLPITAITSILHRISGIIVFFAMSGLLYMLQQSLNSAESFQSVKDCLNHPLSKFVFWVAMSALIYHAVAGIRHLFMDVGWGESLEGGRLGSKLVLMISAIFIVLLGVWLW